MTTKKKVSGAYGEEKTSTGGLSSRLMHEAHSKLHNDFKEHAVFIRTFLLQIGRQCCCWTIKILSIDETNEFFLALDSLDFLPKILSGWHVSVLKSRAQLMCRSPILASGAAAMAEAGNEGVSQTKRNKKRLREKSLAEAQTSCLLWPS